MFIRNGEDCYLKESYNLSHKEDHLVCIAIITPVYLVSLEFLRPETRVCFWLGSPSAAWQPATKFAVGPDMLYLVMLRKSGSLELESVGQSCL